MKRLRFIPLSTPLYWGDDDADQSTDGSDDSTLAGAGGDGDMDDGDDR